MLCSALYSALLVPFCGTRASDTGSRVHKLTRRINELEMNPHSDQAEIQNLKDEQASLQQEQEKADQDRETRRGGGSGA